MAEIFKTAQQASQEVRRTGQTGQLTDDRPSMEPPRTAIQPPVVDVPEPVAAPVNPIDDLYAQYKQKTAPRQQEESVGSIIDTAYQDYLSRTRPPEPLQQEAAPVTNKDAGVVSDIGNLLGLGVNNLALSVRELVGRIPGVGQSIVSGLDSIDQWASGKSSEALLKDNIKQGQAALTQETRAAQDKDWWDSEKGTFGSAWSDPRAYMSGVFQSLPEQAVTMFPVFV
jgi:hypothetical protein